jgi:microcystin-dependent protein
MAYLGEIRPVGFNFSTVGWAFCDGQLLQISQYEALFALIGTTYGGDGQTTFGLPDLRGRIPIHMGTSPQGETFALGQAAGSESVTLSTSQMPTHAHSFSFQPQASGNAGSQTSPANAYYACPDGFSRWKPTRFIDTALSGGELYHCGGGYFSQPKLIAFYSVLLKTFTFINHDRTRPVYR